MKGKKGISKIFVLFLLVSVLIWFLLTLSKTYITTVSFPLKYEPLPQNKLLQVAPLKNIEISLQASGFKIATTKFLNKPIQLKTNALKRKTGTIFYLLTKNQIVNISKQLPSQIEMLEVLKDTIYLNIGSLTSKKIPVKANLEIDYQVGYDISGAIALQPDSLLISGAVSKLDTIHFIELKKMKLSEVSEDFSKEISVKQTNIFKDIKLNTSKVTVSGKVEKFTEGNFEVPFKIINLPKELQLTTLTESVKVSFVVGLSNFNKITKGSFEVICDYKMSEKNNLTYLIPKLIGKPSMIKSYKIVPTKVDFLIQK